MQNRFQGVRKAVPGLLLCAAVTIAAVLLARVEILMFQRAWLESLVLAILLGSAIRTLHPLDPRFEPGIHFSATILLEIAVVLLGAAVSVKQLQENGAGLIAGIAAVVVLAIVFSYVIGRGAGLPRNMALLIACGNAICGNSAIAAIAPVIHADPKDVASAISFTAVLGVAVVLVLPVLGGLAGFTPVEYGVLAGLTVYAVPQVLAATTSVSVASVHVGTLVKLVRVLMLGPVVLTLALRGRKTGCPRPKLSQLLPWFIVGFLIMLVLRSIGAIPVAMVGPAEALANALTVMAMAALGLGVDARNLWRAGPRVAAVVIGSLLALGAMSYLLIKLLGV